MKKQEKLIHKARVKKNYQRTLKRTATQASGQAGESFYDKVLMSCSVLLSDSILSSSLGLLTKPGMKKRLRSSKQLARPSTAVHLGHRSTV